MEKLVSQNRNAVTDIRLDGVSIAAGGSMNLLVGNTYTIQLVGATATNGYEQIESFINFPNTIFKVSSVTASYSASPTPHTDPNWASKQYADGCGWNNDPVSGGYRSCSSTGKYGGNIIISYNVTVIGGGGTSQVLNTLIYDFSGSSYHYNSDFSASSRIAVITDPSTCALSDSSIITQWTFTGNTTTASTNPGPSGGVFVPGSGLIPVPFGTNASYTVAANPPLSYEDWTSNASFLPTDYYEFSVPTAGYNSIWLTFYVSTTHVAFESADLKYSTDGINFSNFVSWTDLSPAWQQKRVDLSAITNLNNQTSRVYFRLYGYSSGNANRDLSVDDVTIRGCKIPASLSLAKSGSPAYFTAGGQTISYTYTLTNTGSTTLYSPYTVSDNLATVSCPGAPTQLNFGDQVLCTASYIVKPVDVLNQGVTNIATAAAQANYGGTRSAIFSNQATESIESAAWTVIKEASTTNSGPWSDSVIVNPGDPVYFRVTVENSGAANLTGIMVDDGLADCILTGPTGDSDTDTILDPTEAWVYTCSMTAFAGVNITNTVTVDSIETDPSTDMASFTVSQPTSTPTTTPTNTPSDTPTNTPTDTPTQTATGTPTSTPTTTPTDTLTNTPTNIPVNTFTNTPTDTPTRTPTSTPTNTLADTPTHTPTQTPTGIYTSTPTKTETNTPISTPTPTTTDTATPTGTPTLLDPPFGIKTFD